MTGNTDILKDFEEIIGSIKRVEKNAEIFRELKHISSELSELKEDVENKMKTVFKNIEDFDSDVSLYSQLLNFQKEVVNCTSSVKSTAKIFEFLKQNIVYDFGFILFKLDVSDSEYSILSPFGERPKIQKFIKKSDIEPLRSYIEKKAHAIKSSEMAHIGNIKVDWQILGGKTAIIFPLSVMNKNIGMGILVGKENSFQPKDVALLNLVLGLISLIIYHNEYLTRLKTKLIKHSALRKINSDTTLSKILEKWPVSLFILDSNNLILQMNERATKTWTKKDEILLGENFLDFIPKTYKSGLLKTISEVHEEKIGTFISPLISENGPVPIVEMLIGNVKMENQSVSIVLAVDISERYFKELVEHRNELLDELDQFSRILVGQFNNLLTVILPNISILRNLLKANNSTKKYLDSIEKTARRSSNLVQKFLNYDVEDTETIEEININKLVMRHLNSLREDLPERIKTNLNLDTNIRRAKFYPIRIIKLLDILIANSLIALQNKQNAEIDFSTKQIKHNTNGLINGKTFYLEKGEYVELCVRDNGVGIPPNSIMQVLKPFYSTRVKNEGVGLELFIAYNLVKDMKGHIFFDSQLDKYTAVYIYLPFREEDKMQTTVREKVEISQDALVKKPTILVVDDEYNIRSMMREIMEMSGLKVFTAGNGKDGVETFKKNREIIDLIIMDMVMPVMDGREAFSEIKKIDPDQKIFIISGYSQREDLEDMLDKGAVGFMRKPFQVKEIVNRVKQILESSN